MARHNELNDTGDVRTKQRSMYALSLDTWAVLVALAAAVLVRLHVITTVKW